MTTFSLLHLPTELRLQIWTYLFILSSSEIEPWPLTQPNRRNQRFRARGILSILTTCRTIYQEALPILYRHNTFIFHYAQHLRTFYHRDTRVCALIQSIHLCYRSETPTSAFKTLALFENLRSLHIDSYGGELDHQKWHERHALESPAMQQLLKLRGLVSVKFHLDMEDEEEDPGDRVEYEKLCDALQVLKLPKGEGGIQLEAKAKAKKSRVRVQKLNKSKR